MYTKAIGGRQWGLNPDDHALLEQLPQSVHAEVRRFVSQRVDRRRVACKQLMQRICAGDASALQAFFRLTMEVVDDVRDTEMDVADDAKGVFHATTSAALLLQENRTVDLVSAVGELRSPRSIIDAGCGASCVLGMAGAALHDADVTAIEYNPISADAARHMAEICGVKDKVRVVVADALQADLGGLRADALVTETFGIALMDEKGVQIAQHLRKFLKRDGVVLPGAVQVDAEIEVLGRWGEPRSAREVFPLTHFDLRHSEGTDIHGHDVLVLEEGDRGVQVHLHSRFFRPDGRPLIKDAELSVNPYMHGCHFPACREEALMEFDIRYSAGAPKGRGMAITLNLC